MATTAELAVPLTCRWMLLGLFHWIAGTVMLQTWASAPLAVALVALSMAGQPLMAGRLVLGDQRQPSWTLSNVYCLRCALSMFACCAIFRCGDGMPRMRS